MLSEFNMVGSLAGNSEEAPTLTVRCFGNFALLGSAGWVPGPSLKKGHELLAYLVTHPRGVASKTRLIDAFWPGIGSDEGSHRLHLAVSGARTALRAILPARETIASANGGYGWHPSLRLKSDVASFLSHAGDASVPAMRAGVELYQGELLSAIQEDWITPMRVHCSSSYLDMLLGLAQDALAADDHKKSLEYGLRIMEDDPGHEAGARTVMSAFALAGRRSAALMHFEGLRSYLLRHFDVAPMEETIACCRRIREGLTC